MEDCKNPNAPKKGVRKVVEPIRRTKDIRNIIKLLADKPRDQLLFVLGINNGLRMCDILKLRVRDVRFLDPNGSITIIESKRGKANTLKINEQTYKVLHRYLYEEKLHDDDFLFRSKKGGHIKIGRAHV
jgi:integrase